MPDNKSNQKREINPPLFKVGRNPLFPKEIARLWSVGGLQSEVFRNVVRAATNDPSFFAWLIAILANDIAADFAKRKGLDPEDTFERLIEPIATHFSLSED